MKPGKHNFTIWMTGLVTGMAAIFLVASCGKSGDAAGRATGSSVSGAQSTTAPPTMDSVDPPVFYVCRGGSPIIEQVTLNGTVSRFATLPGNSNPQGGMVVDAVGNLYVSECRIDDPFNYQILKITHDGAISVFATPNTHYAPFGLTSDDEGNMYMAEQALGSCQISKITPAGFTSTVTSLPRGSCDSWLALDSSGNLYVSAVTLGNQGNNIAEINSIGSVRIFASLPPACGAQGIAVDDKDCVFVATVAGKTIYKFNPDGTSATKFASLPANSFAQGMVFDHNGNLFLADSGNKQILKITAQGSITTFATGVDQAGAIVLRDLHRRRPVAGSPASQDDDINGEWVGKNGAGTVATYVFRKDGKMLMLIDDPQVKAAYPNGVPCKYSLRRASPEWQLDIRSVDASLGVNIQGIFKRISPGKFKFEASGSAPAERPKSFGPDAVDFTKVKAK